MTEEVMEVMFHPVAAMFPMMRPGEFKALVEDIRTHGLHEPIAVYERMILDGRNRYRACIKAGIEPRYREIELRDHDAAMTYVISMNLQRRHLSQT